MLEVASLVKKYEIQNISSENTKFFEMEKNPRVKIRTRVPQVVTDDPRGEVLQGIYMHF